MGKPTSDRWAAGDSYDAYMGRWSRMMADAFLDWLDEDEGQAWLDVGCGTGALSAAVLDSAAPRSLLGFDPAEPFVAHAQSKLGRAGVRFGIAGADALPLPDDAVDVTVSALALNFTPDPAAALAEMARVTRDGGTLAFYVWDYPGGGLGFLDAFWTAAAAIDPKAADLDEARRFAFCTKPGLQAICADAGLGTVQIEPLTIATRFPDFDTFWHPFTLGTGPAPAYVAACDASMQAQLRDRLARLAGPDGALSFDARAWAMRVRLD
ncbi:class I SAM-dependent methyltransferase [Oceanomicrobium pacificus]|uniref:Methyltransferase domain-containing protein n=1 Tax=Oceanomicrobium pacificus TaxID=2692916 RepID=A0A6B0TPY8_9RHOB|nr:class I SAM-dependent methyltransferase [Oceanomicrobium pacificus]MXU66740.1 methyltransferase domain-containing protein [Oceanomicrobium pacificus]